MNRETPCKTIQQGNVTVYRDTAYWIKGNDESVTFYIDVSVNCDIWLASHEEGCPALYLIDDKSRSINDVGFEALTLISFPEFKGWSFFAGRGGGQAMSIALRRH